MRSFQKLAHRFHHYIIVFIIILSILESYASMESRHDSPLPDNDVGQRGIVTNESTGDRHNVMGRLPGFPDADPRSHRRLTPNCRGGYFGCFAGQCPTSAYRSPA
jgi:hypothetical protein